MIDIATAVALGGDCAADLAVLRAQPAVFGPVASDPTVSRLVAELAADMEWAFPGDPRSPRGGVGQTATLAGIRGVLGVGRWLSWSAGCGIASIRAKAAMS